MVWASVTEDPRFDVDEFGVVRRRASGFIYSQYQDDDGYWRVSLPFGIGPKLVHRLVAHAFLGPEPPGLVVNHIDHDKANCYITNLEYVTQRRNVQAVFDKGCRKGHPWTSQSEYRAPNGRRRCRICASHLDAKRPSRRSQA